MTSHLACAAASLCVALTTACADSTARSIGDVSSELADRTGSRLREEEKALLPPGVSLEDGLSRSEAVEVALWNNAAFQSDVAELGFARAELAAAGVLRNPILSFLFPLGPKQLEATLTWPFQELWLRPRRVTQARLRAEQVADRLLGSGLQLAATAKEAHADLAAARRRAELGAEASHAWERLARLAESRLDAGDISRAEAAGVQSRAGVAADEAQRLRSDVASQLLRLQLVLGLDADTLPEGVPLETEGGPAPGNVEPAEVLVGRALASRPDARAAELGVQAAGERIGLERGQILHLTAIVDANGSGDEGFEMGPGLQLELPIFDQRQGNVAVARADLERTLRRYAAVRSQVEQDVRQARLRLEEAGSSLRAWRESVLPGVAAALDAATQGREAGELSDIEVEEARLRHLDATRRAVDLEADLLRTLARLENAVGRELESP